jgi:hypothetical protein
MFRRSLFLGLTVMLAAVLGYLMWQGRNEEKKVVSPRPKEIIREWKPTAIRAIAPLDIRVVTCRVRLGPTESSVSHRRAARTDATHDLEIRNAGASEYQNVVLRISYLGKGNRILESRNQLISQPLPPASNISVEGIQIRDVPGRTTGCVAHVLYADIGSPSAPGR